MSAWLREKCVVLPKDAMNFNEQTLITFFLDLLQVVGSRKQTYFPPKHGDIPWQFNFKKLKQVQVLGSNFIFWGCTKTRFYQCFSFIPNCCFSKLPRIVVVDVVYHWIRDLKQQKSSTNMALPNNPIGHHQNGSRKNPQISRAHIWGSHLFW